MTPAALLACLEASGLTVRAEGERLLVSPSDRLTPELRKVITASKPELLAALRQPSALEAFLMTHSPQAEIEVIIDKGGGRFVAVSAAEYLAVVGG